MKHYWLVLLLGVLVTPACASEASSRRFDVTHEAHFDAATRTVQARIVLSKGADLVYGFDFNAPEPRFSAFEGDGSVVRDGKRVLWQPPKDGGTLRYLVQVDHKRGERFDAVFKERWALLRVGDLFPAARVRLESGARSRSTLKLSGPDGWSFVTRYGDEKITGARRYVRPTGWMLAGELGVRREEIGGRQVVVAAPRGQGVRRLDMLTFLRFTLPSLEEQVAHLPQRLLIVAAKDGLWRGALSGPGSLYVHADRPLVSENGTSTLLHELVHVGGGFSGDDWLLEGLAEYLSLRALKDSGGLSEARFQGALEHLGAWAEREGGRLTNPSTGANTACAVVVLAEIDRRLPGGLTSWPAMQSGEVREASLRQFLKRSDTAFPECG